MKESRNLQAIYIKVFYFVGEKIADGVRRLI